MAHPVHVVIGLVLVLAVLAGIVVRPRGISEAWVALGGAAILIARAASGSGMRLYIGVFALGTLTTMFLSNDATALMFTPIVYTLVTRLRLPVLPFMFACTFIADTASFLLPVSNPTNILVLPRDAQRDERKEEAGKEAL